MKLFDSLPQTSKDRIEEFEQRHQIKLPADYVQFLLQHNGGRPELPVFSITNDPRLGSTGGIVHFFYGLGTDVNLIDIEDAIEDYVSRVPSDLLPIADDVGGNAICIGISGERRGQIFFWDHSEEEEPDEQGNFTYYNVAFVAPSFSDFIADLKAEDTLHL